DIQLAAQTLEERVQGFTSHWDPQMQDAMSFAYEAFKRIKADLELEGRRDITINDIRERVSVTGHSLGGALAEMVAKFYGLPGFNIDGPGVQTLAGKPEFTAWKDKVEGEGLLPGLQRDYALMPGDFTAFAFTLVGKAGTNLPGTSFEATPEADRTFDFGSQVVVFGLEN